MDGLLYLVQQKGLGKQPIHPGPLYQLEGCQQSAYLCHATLKLTVSFVVSSSDVNLLY